MAASSFSLAESDVNKGRAPLEKELAESQAHIQELQKRINALEERMNAITALGIPAAATKSATSKTATSITPPALNSNSAEREKAARSAENNPSAVAKKGNGGEKPESGGSTLFSVDEAAAQRALERTLTQSGALLLPSGTVELSPSFSYRLSESTPSVLAAVNDPRTSTPSVTAVTQRSQTEEIMLALGLRVGLPMKMQFEASVPASHVHNSRNDDFGNSQGADGTGFGDVTLGIAKTFLQESGWKPDLIGRLTYGFGNGKRQTGLVPFSGGFRQFGAEISALKRQDPLAFTAGISYNHPFEKDGLRPGNGIGFNVGTTLAASPNTSLQFGFSQIWRQRQELFGKEVAGTDQKFGILGIGATSVLSRDVAFIAQIGVGLGRDAPKYSANFSVPILFR